MSPLKIIKECCPDFRDIINKSTHKECQTAKDPNDIMECVFKKEGFIITNSTSGKDEVNIPAVEEYLKIFSNTTWVCACI